MEKIRKPKHEKKMNQEDLDAQNKALKKIIKALEKYPKNSKSKEDQNNKNN